MKMRTKQAGMSSTEPRKEDMHNIANKLGTENKILVVGLLLLCASRTVFNSIFGYNVFTLKENNNG